MSSIILKKRTGSMKLKERTGRIEKLQGDILKFGLVAYYPFDGDVKDHSGNGNDGIINGDPQFVGGISGQALKFDGIDDDIKNTVPPPNGISTVSVWVKNTSISSEECLCWLWSNGCIIKVSPSGSLNVYDGSSYHLIDVAITDGEWHHIARVDNGNTLKFYVDGILAASYESNIFYGPHLGFWFTDYKAARDFFSGSADEIRVYNRVLSYLEIQKLYELKV